MNYKRKEIIGDCVLYLGDAVSVLETLGPVDCVVADPPYGLGEPTGTIQKAKKNKRDYNMFEDTHQYLLDISVPIVSKALSLANGRGIVTPGAAHAWDYPKPDVLGVFFQPATASMCSWGRATQQPVLFYGKDPRAGKDIQHTGVVVTERSSCLEHPCAKPQRAWEWVVNRVSLEGHTVLDPFMGSGTTGVACVKLGRKFIGIELDEKYFDIAVKRIEKAYAQPDFLLQPPKLKPVQVKLEL